MTATTAELNLLDFSAQTGISTKFLRGDGTYQTVSGGGGSKHTIQNGGSDLTERAGLNFDGTHIVATDDSGNDQTDITLSSNLQALSGLTSAADKGIQFTGSGTAATFDLTTAGKAL